MQTGRLASLEIKHNKLHKQIEALEAEKAPDKYIKPLKIEKLKLKDEILKLKGDQHSHGMNTLGDDIYDS